MSNNHDCLFCRIVRQEEPAFLVYEDETVLAFLDHRPLFPGHCLLLPKTHYQTLTDVPENLVSPLFVSARRIATAVEDGMAADGTFVAMNNRVSQSVPHLHVHIVPRRKKDGLKGFFWPRRKYKDNAEAETAANHIRAAIQRTSANTAPDIIP